LEKKGENRGFLHEGEATKEGETKKRRREKREEVHQVCFSFGWFSKLHSYIHSLHNRKIHKNIFDGTNMHHIIYEPP